MRAVSKEATKTSLAVKCILAVFYLNVWPNFTFNKDIPCCEMDFGCILVEYLAKLYIFIKKYVCGALGKPSSAKSDEFLHIV